ncbi:MAG: ABC transporter ATP-binding protein [Pyrobaculum sp.]|nr:ABC transporter ATP-binding protein [Pyrobaculum sp.]
MALLVENLTARRGSFTLRVERLEVNSVVAVVGRNGSGKTTLLDAIAGVIKAEGRVETCGRDVSRLPPERRRLAYVQSLPVDPPTRVDKFLRALAKMHGTEAEVETVAERLGIKQLLTRRTGLSTGQKQLVNLAAALLTRPCAFLMDEPTSHLDWINKKAFNDAVKELNAPVLYVTHDPFEALYVADTICILENGTIKRCTKEKQDITHAYKLAETLLT